MTLEQELKEVEEVRMGLVATKDNPLGHWKTYKEPHHTMSDGGKIPSRDRDGYDPDDVIVTYTEEKRFIVPAGEPRQVIDKETRQSAKKRLKEIYDNTGWYSVKYQAGEGLRKDDMPLDDWISELNIGLHATTTEEKSEWFMHPYSNNGQPAVEETWEETNPNIDSRLNFLEDAYKLYEFTNSVYIKRLIRKTSKQNEGQVKQLAHEFLQYHFRKTHPKVKSKDYWMNGGVLGVSLGFLAPLTAYGIAAIYNPEVREYFQDLEMFLSNVGLRSAIIAGLGMYSGMGIGASIDMIRENTITKRQFKKWVNE